MKKMEKPKRRGHSRIDIKELQDFNDICSDIIDDFLEDFQEREGLTRKPDEEDFDLFGHDSITFMYTQEGMRLYDRMYERLYRVGLKYFSDQKEHITFSTSRMIMP